MMRKTLKIIVAVMVIFILTACGTKKALSDDELKTKLTQIGFDVNEITSSIEDSNISVVRTANNKKYQIEYYVFKSEDTAKVAYENNVKMFSSNKKYAGKETGDDNYNKYVQETDDYYNVVTRVKDTLVYVSVNVDHKRDIKKVLNELGY